VEAIQVSGGEARVQQRTSSDSKSFRVPFFLSEGVKKGILFTGEDNIAAQRAYEALGFRRIGDYSIVLLRSPLKNSLQEMAENDAGEM